MNLENNTRYYVNTCSVNKASSRYSPHNADFSENVPLSDLCTPKIIKAQERNFPLATQNKINGF